MYVRPDRPLVVKCTFDRWNKHISFASAKNCSYDLLKNKVWSQYQVINAYELKQSFIHIDIVDRTVLLPLCYSLRDLLQG